MAQWWLKNIVFLIIVGAVLFLASGNLTWGMAWAYLFSLAIIVIANALAMDPSLMVERAQIQEGTKNWDVALASFVAIGGPLLTWLLAGFDNQFAWSRDIALIYQIAALILVILGGLLGTWSMAANKYFSATVRIQTDRNHKVVTKGPYMYIRHPGYVSGIISIIMTPIALQSWIALIPAIFVACGYIIRTKLEDKVLLEELEGYQKYARKVRYRLVPHVW